MLPWENNPKCGRKRSLSAVDEVQSVERPEKRARGQSSSRQEAKAAFWDSLSRVHLTRRALKELDRRNQLHIQPRTTASRIRPNQSRPLKTLRDSTGQIKRFARHGGPDLTDLRAFPDPELDQGRSAPRAMAPSHSTSRTRTKSTNTLGKTTGKTSTTKTKKSSPYDTNFEQHLVDRGIYPVRYNHLNGHAFQKPANEKEIRDALTRSRSSLSPSRFPDETFDDFVQANEDALSEDKVKETVYPILRGTTKIPSERGKLLANWAHLTDGSLVTAKPDAYDGANPAQIQPSVREDLASHILPSTQYNSPVLPNFFVEVKGPDGSAAVARRQACYDGALGARGMHSLQNYGAEESTTFDNNAYTVTSTYHSGTGSLHIYATHPTQPLDSKSSPDYHMTQLRSFAMTDTVETFREGVGAFRNARDWTKEQRDKLITAANTRALETQEHSQREASTESISESSSNSQLSSSSQGAVLQESGTSAEVGPGCKDQAKQPKRGRETSCSEPVAKRHPSAVGRLSLDQPVTMASSSAGFSVSSVGGDDQGDGRGTKIAENGSQSNLRFTPDSELESTYETAHESSDESNGGSTDD